MKQFLKVLIGIVILGAIGFGVYSVLPQYPHDFVKSFVQPVVNSQAKARIDAVKNIFNQDIQSTYRTILESHTKNRFWVYDLNETTATETVTFYGSDAYINIEDIADHDEMLYTSCQVKFVFTITGNKVDITAYIDGEMQDDAVKELMIKQLFEGK